MPVAEVFLGAFLQVLFDRLASPKLLEFATREGIRSRLKKLEDNLELISPVITHAENMLVRETGVDKWCEELRDWAYDADDFLDEVNTKAMQEEEEEEEARRNNTSSSISVSSWVSDLASGFNSGNYPKNADELNSRLEVIFERMREMRQTRKLMKMFGTDITSTPPAKEQRPLEATAHEFDARVFGREQERERIIEQLKSSRGANVEVIAIVGMPGIGKTTLARHVYQSVQQQEPMLFDIKGWVCVSDDYDVNRITRDILESFTSAASDLRSLNELQSKLKEVVGGKRFLLVLDDVWSRNYSEHWAPLRSPFGVGAPGSKILVTTRDHRVASKMQTDDPMKIHRLGTLCDDDCWSVFLQHVVDERNSVFKSEAGSFRDKILDKCKGLPLTAKLLAGLLRGESPGQGWEAILNSGIWDASGNVELSGRKGDGMLPVVMLSYFHLPPKLKRCFSYCSVIPEDYAFGEEEVVLLWMAHGLVSPEGDEQVEVTGAKYFRELVYRSLFQPAPNKESLFPDLFPDPINDSPRFLMHDLIHDMAEIVAGKSCLKIDGVPKIDSGCIKKARYSSYHNFSGLKTEFDVTFGRAKYLREFHSFGHSEASNLTSYVPLVMELKYLRVLCLRSYSVTELPEDIGDLIHLRLIDLSYSSIREFPESTGSLYNLLALKLEGCRRLRTLPAQMRKLINLRNLDCSGTEKLEAMPVDMGKLTSLQKLSKFIVGKGLERGVGQLKGLSHLKGSISISFLENVGDSKEAREANLMGKKGLRELELKWNSDHHGDIQGAVFAELQPHKHLEKLIILGYGGLSFPGWVGHDRFSKMKVIELEDCKKCTSLPPLGKLPGLEEIQIRNMAGIVCVGEEFYGKERGAFPSLDILKFEGLENWSEWSHPAGGSCHFTSLQALIVIRCPKLSMSLPVVPNVIARQVVGCPKLSMPLPDVTNVPELIVRPKLSMSLSDGINVLNYPCLEKLPSELELHQLTSVSKLVISGCDRLPSDLHNLTSLSKLEISGCDKLQKLPSDLHSLTSVSELVISDCDMLEKLSNELHYLTSLRELRIVNCRRLSCLSEMDFPSTMESLVIWRCELLTCLSPSVSSSSHSLKRLDISDCKNLESLVGTADSFPSLESLRIVDCPKLKSLPEGIHRRLKVLTIVGYQYLGELSISVPHLPALETLGIRCSPNPNSLPPNLRQLDIAAPMTPNDDDKLFSVPLPSSLTSLTISKFKKLSPEAFQNLTSLQYLSILDCPDLTSIPDQLLPPSSLLSLQICGCPGLTSIPDQLLPPSLRQIYISDCRGLRSIPDQSLPPLLRRLDIVACPLLASDFAKGKGRYWPKVKFIPSVNIDCRSIFEPEEEE